MPPRRVVELPARSPIAWIATERPDKAIADIIRCRALRTATGISEKPAAGICRTQAHQQHHVQCRAFVEPGNDYGACRGIPRARSETARRRSEEPGRSR